MRSTRRPEWTAPDGDSAPCCGPASPRERSHRWRARVVGAHERQCRLVVKVRPLAAHRLLRLRQQRHRFPPTVAALFAARDPPLCGFQRALGCAIPTWVEDARPIGEGRKGLNPQVDPGFLSRSGKRLYGNIGARNGDVPPIRFFGDGDDLGCPLKRATPMHAETPDLGQDKKAVLPSPVSRRCRTP